MATTDFACRHESVVGVFAKAGSRMKVCTVCGSRATDNERGDWGPWYPPVALERVVALPAVWRSAAEFIIAQKNARLRQAGELFDGLEVQDDIADCLRERADELERAFRP